MGEVVWMGLLRFGRGGVAISIVIFCDFGFLVKTNELESYRAAIRFFMNNKNTVDCAMIREISEQNDMNKVAITYISEYKKLSKF